MIHCEVDVPPFITVLWSLEYRSFSMYVHCPLNQCYNGGHNWLQEKQYQFVMNFGDIEHRKIKKSHTKQGIRLNEQVMLIARRWNRWLLTPAKPGIGSQIRSSSERLLTDDRREGILSDRVVTQKIRRSWRACPYKIKIFCQAYLSIHLLKRLIFMH